MKTSKFSAMLLGMALGLAGAGSNLHAQIIYNTLNIDFQPGPTGDGGAVAYSGSAGDTDTGGTLWNVVAPTTDGAYNGGFGTGGDVTGPLSATSLLNSDGSASTVTLSGTNTGGNLAAFATYNTGVVAQDATGLMQDYIIAQNYSTQSVTLSGLTIGSEYDLYLYGAGDQSVRQTAFTVNGLTEATSGIPGGTGHDLTAGQDYVEFTGTLASTSLSIAYATAQGGGNPEGDFNGLQLTTGNIEAVPEPSSCALLLAGGLALVFFTYRTRQRTF